MTIPAWVLLAFALWTLLILIGTVGAYRWREILAGRVAIRKLRYDALDGHPDWYRRGMRAHGNCVENLPVYAALVLLLHLLGLDNARLDTLALILILGRVCQSLVHVALAETNAAVTVRFGFFFVQLAVMFWIGVEIALSARI